MSSPDLNFHAQVESVLSKLVKVATVELTNLFETRYLAFAGDAVKSEERHETLDIRECVEELGGKAVSCSIGVQVNGRSNETAKLRGPRNLSGRSDCLRGGEEQWVSTTDPLTEERNGQGDRLGILVEENENQSTVRREAPTPPPRRAGDAIGHDPLSPASPPPSRCTPKVAEEGSQATAEDLAPPTPPLFPKREPQDPKVDPPKPTVRPEPQQTEETAAPLPQVEAWECVSPSKEDTPNDLQMKLKRAGRPQRGAVRPCSVRLVNIEAAAAAAAIRSPTRSSSSPPLKDLRRHQGMHTGHRLCCYTACDNGVWRLQGVVAHTRGGYPCAVCGKNFKRRKILRRHERFHTGERPYACPRCPKTFALRKSLRRHQRFHTGERPHDCPKCGKSFRLRENLKAHLRFHSGEKPYACSVCEKTFRIARNLEKHTVDQCGFTVPSFRQIAGLVG